MSEETVYACKESAGFQFRVDEKRYRFVKHELRVFDADEVAAIDEAIKKYPNLKRYIKKVDVAEAEALVAAHIAAHGGAQQGPFTSQSAGVQLAQRDNDLANAVGEQGMADLNKQMEAENNLILTEKSPSMPEKPANPEKPKTLLDIKS